MDMGNNAGLDHFGGYGRAEVGMEYRISNDVFAQAGAGASLGWLNRGLGAGVNSSLNAQSIFANGRVGYSLLGGNLRFTGGIQLGVAHVGAPECQDGTSCGAVFTRNPQLLPIDSWGFLFGGEVGVSTLQGALGLYVRASGMFGVNPAYNVVDGDHLNFGLNIPDVQVGIGVDLVSIYNLIAGNGASRPATAEPRGGETAVAPAVAPAATGGTPAVAPVAEAPVAGLALVRARRESASASRTQAVSAAELVTSARTSYSAITGTAEADMRSRRVQALEVLNQSQTVLSAYQDVTDVLEEAQAALPSLRGTERTDANRAIQEITNWQTETRRLAGQAYRQARQTAEDFNRLPNHGEDVPFNMLDPTPPAVRSTSPRPRRRPAAAVVHPPAAAHPPAVAPPPVVAHPPAVVPPPVVAHPPAVVPPPVVAHPPAVVAPPRADAGAPVFVFGGGGGGATGGADAGVRRRRPDE